jgi:hypothetical protein
MLGLFAPRRRPSTRAASGWTWQKALKLREPLVFAYTEAAFTFELSGPDGEKLWNITLKHGEWLAGANMLHWSIEGYPVESLVR